MLLKPRLPLISKALKIMGLSLSTARYIASQFYADPKPLTAWIKWGNAPVMTEDWINHAAKFDFIALSPGVWEGKREVRDALMRKNLDIRIGTYFQMHTLPFWMRRASPSTYPGKLWNVLHPYIVRNENGQFISIYNSQPLYNFLDQTVRSLAIRRLVEYVEAEDIDWAFLDFCSLQLPNFDGGTGISEAQQAQLPAVWYDYIDELRAALPRDFLLIANGSLGTTHRDFREKLDGVYLERYPRWPGDGAERISVDTRFTMLGNPDLPNYLDWSSLADLIPGIVNAYHQTADEWPPIEGEK